ncbi:MAG: alpha-N-arabinofuranosidase [Planctomycetota bacterium]|jgi:alpha-N-arabinofuranosidase
MSSKLVVQADLGKQKISRHIYGHFSEHLGRCIYGGYWVGEDSRMPNTRGIRKDIVEALKRIKIPNLRWPGGCFADEYHWMDGIGPKDQRPTMLNTHWGGVTENNHFGTHEFFDLCGQLGCEPYICGNVGSGTAREMQQWVEYITLDAVSPMADLRRKNGRDEPWRIRFWGVGNENWGCGGNMRPEYYADLYRRYQTYLRNLSGNRLFKIACGGCGENYQWTEVLMRECAGRMAGLSYHYYCGSGRESRSATRFEQADWFFQLKNAFRTDELLTRHSAVMDKYDPERKVALVVDEWGAWHQVEQGTNPAFLYQQNSLRDALVAALTLNIFNAHCDRVKMANLAQTVNVLQAVVLTEGEKMILTPTYHVFEMYKVHQDAVLLPGRLDCEQYEFDGESIPAVSASASRGEDCKVHLTLCNLDPNRMHELDAELRGADFGHAAGRVLTAATMTAHNTFEKPSLLEPQAFDGARVAKGRLTLQLPPKSVVALEIT